MVVLAFGKVGFSGDHRFGDCTSHLEPGMIKEGQKTVTGKEKPEVSQWIGFVSYAQWHQSELSNDFLSSRMGNWG
jgi:hypothetical protein